MADLSIYIDFVVLEYFVFYFECIGATAIKSSETWEPQAACKSTAVTKAINV